MNILSSPTTAYLRWSLESNTNNYHKTMEKLASGSDISCCRDDVIKYQKSSIISSKISQNSIIKDNIKYGSDAINVVVQAEDNVLSQISTIRDLCLQVSNETYSSTERDFIINEIRSRLDYVDYVAATTSFNGRKLLDGSCSEYRIQIAADQYVDISKGMTDVHVSALGIDLDPSITGDNWSIDDITNYIEKLDIAEDTIINFETNAGSFSTGLDNSFDLKDSANESLQATRSDMIDTDYAKMSAEFVKYQILQQCSINMEVNYNQLAGQTFNLLYPKS